MHLTSPPPAFAEATLAPNHLWAILVGSAPTAVVHGDAVGGFAGVMSFVVADVCM